MKLDIDQILDLHHKWDLTVKVCGKDYATVRPSVGQITLMSGIPAMDAEQLKQLIQSLFAEDSVPDVGAWNIKQATAFLNGYAAYFAGRIRAEKKLEAVATMAAAAVMEGAVKDS